MTDNRLLLLMVYKFIWVIVGVALIYIGCKCYKSSHKSNSGEINASLGGLTVLFKNAPLEVISFVLGAIVIISSLWKGIEANDSKKQKQVLKNSTSDIQVIHDTIYQIVSNDSISIDSLLEFGNKRFEKNEYLEAYGVFYLAHSLAPNNAIIFSRMRMISERIKRNQNGANSKASNHSPEIEYIEETSSFKIKDETVDTLN